MAEINREELCVAELSMDELCMDELSRDELCEAELTSFGWTLLVELSRE